jgi:hypothetical protein
MKTVSLGASRPSAVSFRMYDPCPLSFSVNKQSYSVPLGDRLEEAVAAHSLACAWLPPCFSGRRGTTWCRYASTSRWMASATGTPSPGTREVPTHPSCSSPPSSPRLIHSLAAPAADPDSEIISFAKRTAKDLKLPATFVPPMLQSIQVPLSPVPPSLLGFTAFLLIYNGLVMLFWGKKGQLAEFRSYEGQEMQLKEKIVPLKVTFASLPICCCKLSLLLIVFISNHRRAFDSNGESAD